MITYNGNFIENNGAVTPFKFVAEGCKFSILYDEGEKKIVKTLRIIHNAKWLWKLNEKSISCRSVAEMMDRFSKYPAYARATFRCYCR